MDDLLKNEEEEVPGAIVAVPESLMRVYYILLFAIVLSAAIHLWRKISAMDRTEESMSLRGEILGNSLIFLTIYAISWLPVLFLGILDGELETSSISEGMKGQVANAHCALQDLFVRTFCMYVVISTALYLRYGNAMISEECCMSRPNVFAWGMLVPLAFVELTRHFLEQQEWLMPTGSVLQHLGSVRFSIKSTPVLCVQLINVVWMRQIVAEWLMTTILVVIASFCCAPCYYHEKKNKQKQSSKSEGDLESNSTSPAAELQMESLIDLESPTSRDSKLSGSLKTHQLTPKSSHLISESRGLYARGAGFFETISFIGVLWATILRPFMAIGLYIMNTEMYSNHLDIPTHVLMIIAIAVLPAEINPKYKNGEEEEEEEQDEEKTIGKHTLTKEKDEIPIWMEEECKRAERQLKENREGDVEPIWRREK